MDQNSEQIKQTLISIGHNLANLHALSLIIIVTVLTFGTLRLISYLGASLIKAIINYTERTEKAKVAKFQRAENWLNVVLAIVKLFVIGIGVYICWRFIFPSSAPAAVVGAGALFIVIAGGTIGPLLHDITAGSVMLAERWYGVGDFVTVEPFVNLQGVVEQISLRSTKLRGLSGEVIWIHNQHIQAVKVKYRGVTSIALDVFVTDKAKALSLLETITSMLPKGPMQIIGGLKVSDIERLNDTMWRIELKGKTVPGREWLIEKFALEAIKDADDKLPGKQKVIVYGPIARYVDPAAERRFKRSIK